MVIEANIGGIMNYNHELDDHLLDIDMYDCEYGCLIIKEDDDDVPNDDERGS